MFGNQGVRALKGDLMSIGDLVEDTLPVLLVKPSDL